ncbi:hypothetical protein [Streptomyces pactum]|uniref:hypothetical protein n=1 Tax=Streptomyces pactum TaxID=68249 RepID=UPI0036FA61FA
MSATPRSSVPPGGVRRHPPVPAAPAAIAKLGLSAFAERNQPRYTRYARVRLGGTAAARDVVRATLDFARADWHRLLSRPSPAADIWAELHRQIDRHRDGHPPPDEDVTALYRALPRAGADSVLLCRRLGLGTSEAAELMGREPPAVEAALAAARRALPHLVDKGAR